MDGMLIAVATIYALVIIPRLQNTIKSVRWARVAEAREQTARAQAEARLLIIREQLGLNNR